MRVNMATGVMEQGLRHWNLPDFPHASSCQPCLLSYARPSPCLPPTLHCLPTSSDPQEVAVLDFVKPPGKDSSSTHTDYLNDTSILPMGRSTERLGK